MRPATSLALALPSTLARAFVVQEGVWNGGTCSPSRLTQVRALSWLPWRFASCQICNNAAKLAEEQRHNLLLRSKVDFVGRAKALGYQVILVMIHLESPALNQARISEGDFDVPADKVVSRIPRLLRHVRTTLPLCDVARVYDNSSADHPFTPVFTVRHGRIERHVDPLPDWAEALLAGF